MAREGAAIVATGRTGDLPGFVEELDAVVLVARRTLGMRAVGQPDIHRAGAGIAPGALARGGAAGVAIRRTGGLTGLVEELDAVVLVARRTVCMPAVDQPDIHRAGAGVEPGALARGGAAGVAIRRTGDLPGFVEELGVVVPVARRTVGMPAVDQPDLRRAGAGIEPGALAREGAAIVATGRTGDLPGFVEELDAVVLVARRTLGMRAVGQPDIHRAGAGIEPGALARGGAAGVAIRRTGDLPGFVEELGVVVPVARRTVGMPAVGQPDIHRAGAGVEPGASARGRAVIVAIGITGRLAGRVQVLSYTVAVIVGRAGVPSICRADDRYVIRGGGEELAAEDDERARQCTTSDRSTKGQ